MTLPGGADIRINGVDYQVDTSIEDAFVHQYETLLSPRTDISGAPGKQQLREDILLWTFDDWSGGEGNSIYYPDQPTKYDYSVGTNPRVPGKLYGRPTVVDEATETPRDIRRPHFIAFAAGKIWILGGADTTDGPIVMYATSSADFEAGTFTPISEANQGWGTVNNQDFFLTAWAGDNTSIWIAGQETTGGAFEVRRFEDDGSIAGVAVASQSDDRRVLAMQFLAGFMYVWDGRTLEKWDVYSGNAPLLSGDKVEIIDTGWQLSTVDEFNETWWGDLVAGDNALYFFQSNERHSRVYEMTLAEDGTPVPAPLWTAPLGFTIRAIAYLGGVLYVSGVWGEFGDESSAQLWGIFTQNRTIVPVADIRATTSDNVSLDILRVTHGGKLLMVDSVGGKTFMYDPANEAISMFADLDADTTAFDDGYRVSDAATVGNLRTFILYAPDAGSATALDLRWINFDSEKKSVSQDDVTGQYSETGDWDYDFPHEQKALLGFHVGFVPLEAGQRIKLEYSVDGAAFVSAGSITSTTEGADDGRVYLPVSVASEDGSGTVKFHKLRFRTYVESLTGGVVAPEVNSVTVESRLMEHRQSWRIAVRVKNEQPNTRPRSTQRKSKQLRENILTAVENKALVEFVDGFSTATKDADSTTYTVTIENPAEVIDRNGEGYILVTMKEVPS